MSINIKTRRLGKTELLACSLQGSEKKIPGGGHRRLSGLGGKGWGEEAWQTNRWREGPEFGTTGQMTWFLKVVFGWGVVAVKVT